MKITCLTEWRMNQRLEDDDDTHRQTSSLAGLAAMLAIAIAAFFLFQHLKREGNIEDCLLAHRANCDALIDAR